MNRYVAFLRGINVSGHHKVPMADLRKEMEKLNFEKVITILNSGNIIFDSTESDVKSLEKIMSDHLEKTFGFLIPTIVRTSETICHLLDKDPFKDILVTKDIRLYVSFLQEDLETDLQLPWASDNNAFKIIDKIDKTIVSVLDLSITKTPKGMEVLERYYGKQITTRNWNTIKRIEKKLKTNS
ncbi:hypothetical protein ATO12_04270 [Aquimarina atlantica]|uniref:DUF1697 domain-containing protein n=1 Tax=Aquimarina atlantica TaxID=1317122 RepID=A0A023C132_9FLAO|nr:DUF1697 domain-containing protein [Aquimarina atlantica]EZH76011.1 hypothetical protein ATO12_04270 [Aquimarina atlantica]